MNKKNIQKKINFKLGFLLASAGMLVSFFSFCGKRPDANASNSAGAIAMSEEAKVGKELFVKNACNSCHGLEGKGDGPAGKGLNPPPRNYKETTAYKQGFSVDEITNTLLTGVPGTSMVSYKHLSEKDRRALAEYVVYLQKN